MLSVEAWSAELFVDPNKDPVSRRCGRIEVLVGVDLLRKLVSAGDSANVRAEGHALLWLFEKSGEG